ncbi:MAG: RNA polymerase sigma-70 factor, partial [Clostridia bacterium]|nr:RNA polymerase sigma-70 factor [Clostridia bacterium]
MYINDEKWLKDLSEGKDTAFSKLFERFYTPLVIFADSYLDDTEASRDLVQDIFLTLIDKKEIFHTISKLKAYLYTYVKNNCLNQLRKEKVKNRYIDFAQYTNSNEESFWNKVLEEEVYYYLYKAINKLPPKAREVYILSLDGKKNQEIADQLGITVETVKSHKKKNKAVLKKHLDGL